MSLLFKLFHVFQNQIYFSSIRIKLQNMFLFSLFSVGKRINSSSSNFVFRPREKDSIPKETRKINEKRIKSVFDIDCTSRCTADAFVETNDVQDADECRKNKRKLSLKNNSRKKPRYLGF